MAVANFHFSKKAYRGLDSIWQYTAYRWSRRKANEYYQIIMDTCSRIADNPMIGSKYLKDNGEYELYFKAKKHFIFYNVVEGEVNIHRILHENMDLENRLKE